MSYSPPSRWLYAGLLLGALASVNTLLVQNQGEIPKDAVASVDGQLVKKKAYLDYLDLIAADKKSAMTTKDERQILDRMIDEKLLIRRALDIGLTESSATVKKAIVQEMMQYMLSQSDVEEPSRQELEAFFIANQGYFTPPSRLQVRLLQYQEQAQAQRAFALLQNGGTLEQAEALAGWKKGIPIPGAMLPLHKLTQYIGPALTQLSKNMDSGEFSEPQVYQSSYALLIVVKKRISPASKFEESLALVKAEFSRRQGDNAVREYMQSLREEAKIVLNEDFLQELKAIRPQ